MTTTPPEGLAAELAARLECCLDPTASAGEHKSQECRMTNDELLALAACVEALEGPSREVDREIAFAAGYRDYDGGSEPRPAYTASLDAAMTLVPEGHKWSVTQQDSENSLWQWWGELRRGHWTSYDKAFPARAATPALALCAAALRAQQEQHP